MPQHSKLSYVEVLVPKTQSKICRLCEKEDDATVVNNIEQCADLILAIAQIEVIISTEYPSLVCNQCLERLLDAFMMRDLCIESEQRFLKNFLQPGEILTKEENLVDEEADIIEANQSDQDDLIEIGKRVKIEEYMDVETLEEAEVYVEDDELLSEIEVEETPSEFVEDVEENDGTERKLEDSAILENLLVQETKL